MDTDDVHPQTLVIHHASCADGFTAAWVTRMYGFRRDLLGPYELLPAHYGDSPPDVTNRDVVIVDFSYRYDELVEMNEKANSLIVMDHHASVDQRVKDLPFVIFDNDRSGAKIAFDYFCGDQPDMLGSELVDYVQDRDLWQWRLDNSREINEALALEQMTIHNWTSFAADLDSSVVRKDVIRRGRTLLKYRSLLAERKAYQATLRDIRGFTVPVVNVAIKLQSEVGHRLCDDEDNPVPFAATFFVGQDEDGDDIAVFSLRSTDAGENVSEIARSFTYKGRTGGGHRNAAGFTVPLSALFDGLKASGTQETTEEEETA